MPRGEADALTSAEGLTADEEPEDSSSELEQEDVLHDRLVQVPVLPTARAADAPLLAMPRAPALALPCKVLRCALPLRPPCMLGWDWLRAPLVDTTAARGGSK